jgi:hypothetical protein
LELSGHVITAAANRVPLSAPRVVGPDNGAYQCSGSYKFGDLPEPYPALNATEVAAFCDGEKAVVEASQRWLIDNGGYDYNCFQFVNHDSVLPVSGDAAGACASKLNKLATTYGPSDVVVLYGDRTHGELYTDADVKEAVAVFMLTRQAPWFFGYPGSDSLAPATAALLMSDYGAPLGKMTQSGSVFTRQYEHANVTLDCGSFTARFDVRGT